MIGAAITDKRLKNKRFIKTEDAILRVFFECSIYISVDQLAKRIGVARSTVYHHHKTMRDIVPDYGQYVLTCFEIGFSKIAAGKRMRTKTILEFTFTFIFKHKKEFKVLLRGNDRQTFLDMFEDLKEPIERILRLPKGTARMYRVYASEIIELIREWGNEDFPELQIDDLVKRALYLTNTMRARLLPIN